MEIMNSPICVHKHLGPLCFQTIFSNFNVQVFRSNPQHSPMMTCSATLTKRCPRLLALLKRTSLHDDQIGSVKVVRLYVYKNPNDPWFLIGVGAFFWRSVSPQNRGQTGSFMCIYTLQISSLQLMKICSPTNANK